MNSKKINLFIANLILVFAFCVNVHAVPVSAAVLYPVNLRSFA